MTAREQRACTVSVIVPVYNSSATLRECVDSILSQTMQDFEVIFVDDGSADDSPELLERICAADSRFSFFLQSNAGPGVARNVGLDKACGEYVTCLDADDWMEPTLLEKAVGRAQETGAEVVVWDAWLENETTGEHCLSCRVRIDRCDPECYEWRTNPDFLFQSFQNWPWNKLIRRSLLEENGVRFSRLRHTEDLLYTAKALVLANRVAGIPEALSHYRVCQPGSAMANTDSHPFDFIRAFEELHSWLEEQRLFEVLRRSYVDWAVTSFQANLSILRTRQAFDSVFSSLSEERLGAIGVDVRDAAGHLGDAAREELKAIASDSPEDYLFHVHRREQTALEIAEISAGDRWFALNERKIEIDQANGHVAALSGRLEESMAEAGRLEGELAAARLDISRLREEKDALEQSRDMRVGRWILRVPRKLKSIVRGMRK